MDALIVFFGAAALLAAAAIFRAKSLYGRVDAAAAAALALVMVAVGLGWAPLVTGRLEMMLAVALAWFAASIAFRKGGPESTGPFTGIYGAGVTVLAVWVLFSAAHGGGTATDHPAHQLGAILGAVMSCLLMIFAAAGWMMATFAKSANNKAHAVPRLTGIREALIAGGLAMALYAIS
ncbi:hypothetical protein ACFFGR_22380 [Arthrobacter liuii]|nr:hypothetical protein [Arthrobacter liuii]